MGLWQKPDKPKANRRGKGGDDYLPVVVLEDDDPLLDARQSPEAPELRKAKRGSAVRPGRRLASLDAYRGFVMLAMASGALGFTKIVSTYGADPRLGVTLPDGSHAPGAWATMWHVLAYEFDHVPWTGCSFWDLIQPSFMFIVGAAMPFSFAKRVAEGQGAVKRFAHVLFRALVLILLGVFLSSNSSRQTNFTFVNVLTQIGLGYVFVYLMLSWRTSAQVLAAAAILGGYWFYFAEYSPNRDERTEVLACLAAPEKTAKDPRHRAADLGSFAEEGELKGHWNKHTNAAAAFDRLLLNKLPQQDGKTFCINEGGYQTLNFIPSMVTMLIGVMAGRLLMSDRRRKTLTLLGAGLACFALAMALDTTIWPVKVQDGSLVITGFGLDPATTKSQQHPGTDALAGGGDALAATSPQSTAEGRTSSEPWPDWSLCPIVKRIWTPTWTLFSAGWTLWLLAAFYLVMDVVGFQFWAFPLKVVGMNSIAMYVMAQLIKPWVGRTLETHVSTWNTPQWNIWYSTFGEGTVYGPLWQSLAVLGVLWLICLWMYRQRIFIRI
jgi:heparan-alpha-glucosaminide N-acetyltransferase